MTPDEMLAVITAYKEGKKIQYANTRFANSKWEDCTSPHWDFFSFEYRIKPESHYRPFENAREVMEAIKGHGYYIKWGGNGKDYIIAVVCDDYIEPYNDESYTFAEAFESFTWPDGTPFGVKED